jgi:uncharacterized membrane protein
MRGIYIGLAIVQGIIAFIMIKVYLIHPTGFGLFTVIFTSVMCIIYIISAILDRPPFSKNWYK